MSNGEHEVKIERLEGDFGEMRLDIKEIREDQRQSRVHISEIKSSIKEIRKDLEWLMRIGKYILICVVTPSFFGVFGFLIYEFWKLAVSP